MKTIVNIMLLVTACGQQPLTNETATDGSKTATSKNGQVSDQEPTKIKGYLSNAFEITVDGEKYADSEAFYSAQIDRLAENATESGYARSILGQDDLLEWDGIHPNTKGANLLAKSVSEVIMD